MFLIAQLLEISESLRAAQANVTNDRSYKTAQSTPEAEIWEVISVQGDRNPALANVNVRKNATKRAHKRQYLKELKT